MSASLAMHSTVDEDSVASPTQVISNSIHGNTCLKHSAKLTSRDHC